MNLKNISLASGNLANQLETGITLPVAVRRLSRLQKKHSEKWDAVSEGVSRGYGLAEQLKGWWPRSFVSAISSGEYAGELPKVLKQIEKTIETQLEVRSYINKLYYPLGITLAAILVNLFFMVWVLPSLAESLSFGNDEVQAVGFSSLVFSASSKISLFMSQPTNIGIIIIIIISALYVLFKTDFVAIYIMPIILEIPKIGEALTALYFGIWSKYVSFLSSSGGFSIKDQMLIPVDVLPIGLQDGVRLAAKDAVNKGLDSSVDLDHMSYDDPRHKWPFYLINAFTVAHHTGALDTELTRASPPMINEGKKMLELGTNLANLVALIIAAGFVMTPMIAYYMQFAASLQSAIGNV